MDIHSKQVKHKIDHPSRDPFRKRAEVKAAEKLKDLTFKSEGDKRDYERAVRGNDNNIYGLPAFFPPVRTKTFIGMPEVSDEEREYWNRYWRIEDHKRQPVTILCTENLCNRKTLHYISAEDCYCTRCGAQKPHRSVNHN